MKSKRAEMCKKCVCEDIMKSDVLWGVFRVATLSFPSFHTFTPTNFVTNIQYLSRSTSPSFINPALPKNPHLYVLALIGMFQERIILGEAEKKAVWNSG